MASQTLLFNSYNQDRNQTTLKPLFLY